MPRVVVFLIFSTAEWPSTEKKGHIDPNQAFFNRETDSRAERTEGEAEDRSPWQSADTEGVAVDRSPWRSTDTEGEAEDGSPKRPTDTADSPKAITPLHQLVSLELGARKYGADEK